MSDPEQLFNEELEIFRTEAQAGAQFLYSYLAFTATVGKNRKALSLINRTPLFWKTIAAALQTSFFIVLGRIFDQKSVHNIDRLLKIAQDNINIFSKATLVSRKKQANANADEEYFKNSYEPTKHDFRNLRKKVKDYRKIYENNYRDIRSQFYAHQGDSRSSRRTKIVCQN